MGGRGDVKRLEKGEAYGAIGQVRGSRPDEAWWTYRGGAERGGATSAAVGADLKRSWKTELGGELSAVTAADGRVYVARIETHTLHALDMATGEAVWSYTVGSRIDSPPTLLNDAVFFGARDGYIYCLRASDGELAWRYRAAPNTTQAMAFNRLESLWPVHGSVLYVSPAESLAVNAGQASGNGASGNGGRRIAQQRQARNVERVGRQGVVYAAAGRSSYLDGGIRLVGLDPLSGDVVCEKVIESEYPGAMDPPSDADNMSRKNRQNWRDYKTYLAPDRSDSFAMRGARPDILVADADSLYMHHLRFDFELDGQDVRRPHLFATSHLLDGWGHNRNYWVLGTGNFYDTPVAYPWIIKKAIQVPCGLMLCFDRETVWGIRRGRRANTLFAKPRSDPMDKKSSLPDFETRQSEKEAGGWEVKLSIRPRSMVRAGDLLLVGGLRFEQYGDPYSLSAEDKQRKELGRLHIVSCDEGRTIRRLTLASPPVWDGMAAVKRRLFVPCVDGSVVCLSETMCSPSRTSTKSDCCTLNGECLRLGDRRKNNVSVYSTGGGS